MLSEQFENLSRYLPRDIYMGKSLDYAAYHARAISINGEHDLYTMEYFAFHILWMSFLQKTTFQLYRYDPTGSQNALGNDGAVNRILASALNLYDLSAINEKKLCEITKHTLIGYHGNQINNLRELVDKRDHIAHCSGVLDLDNDEIAVYANRCVKRTEEIHQKLETVILKGWDSFIQSLASGGQYSLVNDAVINYLSDEYLSISDIESIVKNRPLSNDNTNDADFRANLALLQIVQIVNDYDISSELDYEHIKNELLLRTNSDEQKSSVQDEMQAFIQFRVGLAK